MTRTLLPWTPRFPRSLDTFRHEMDELMERLFSQEDGGERFGSFTPHVNLSESQNEYHVTVDLPGMKPNEFDVEYKNGELWISGERQQEKEEESTNFHHIERRYGRFRRVIPLSTIVQEDKIDASYHDGVLRLTIPKSETVRPKHIDVKS